ncbi:MAG: L-threonylcarbamoyladenylate synthase [Anaerolineales bacterium]
MNPSIHATLFSIDARAPDPGIIQRAAECLIRGGLVAFPTETVYGLGGHAFDAAAVRRIFMVKQRPPSDPLIVHLASADALLQVASEVSPLAKILAERFWPGPLTLLLPRRASLPLEVCAGLSTVAVRVPSHPVAQALLQASGIPIAAPSANRFAHTSATLAAHVAADLGDRIDMILDAGPTHWGVESTILDPLQTPPVLLRPGGISREELESVAGPVRVASPGERITASPGRQPRHYAPNVRLVLCPGETPEEILASIQDNVGRISDNDLRIGLLAVTEVCSRIDRNIIPFIIRDLGSMEDLRQIARNLFADLRELEAEGVDIILTHHFPTEGLGAAINDRLNRAAQEPFF